MKLPEDAAQPSQSSTAPGSRWTLSVVAATIRQLRRDANLSVAQMAAELAFRSKSSYQYYETGYRKEHLNVEVAERAVHFCVERGIDPERIIKIAPPEAAERLRWLIAAATPPPAWQSTTAPSSPADPPLRFTETTGAPRTIESRVMVGDSMAPSIRAGQEYLVDRYDCEPGRAIGIYLIRYGVHELPRVVQLTEALPVPRLHVSALNPAFSSYDIDYDNIQGRVIGRVIAALVRL